MNLSFFSSVINADILSIFFVFIIILITIPIGIYSIGYMKEYKEKYSTGYFLLIFSLFILSMLAVVVSRNAIVFMVFWEIMSVSSFFLVIFEYESKKNIKSGIMYLIMTHISGLLLLVMFSLLYKYTGSFDFTVIAQQGAALSYTQKAIIFILALSGFGAKAGIIPLHPWLPKAHPAATSNVSALMSGVMLKVALYGFIRLMFMLLANLPLSFGVITMLIGTLTAIYAILNALFQDDIKKLLAYSSAENIGIIMAALGLAMIFAARSLIELGAITLTAALFHILNHAVFKSLLFSGAGSVLYATGTKNMNELGGLYSKMKFAAICTFIGTAAISAVPPLNGFASEILILKSFIMGIGSLRSIVLVVAVVSCGMLIALTSGSAIYAAVKCYGITYLGAPRSSKASDVHPLPLSMKLGMGILALFTVLLGILSPLVIQFISRVSIFVLNTDDFLSASEAISAVSFDITITALIIAFVAWITHLLISSNAKGKAVEVNDTWGCGFNNMKSYMQYSGSGYTQPASRIVQHLVDYRKEVKQKSTLQIKQKTSDIIEKHIYEPITRFILFMADMSTKIHYGRIQLYVSYIFITLIVTAIIVINFI